MQIFNCEDELIHLCGKIQPFGYLLVFNTKGECIAVSENSGKLFNEISKNKKKKDLIYFEI